MWMNSNACQESHLAVDRENLQETGSLIVDRSILTIPARCTGFSAGAPLLPPLNLIDLELLLHWKDRTYQTFCRSPHGKTVWQSLVPQEAIMEPFLMHGILALSAVHLARTKNESLKPAYISRAASHQNQALAKFRPLLMNISPSNSKPMFAYASLITVYSFGSSQEPHPSDFRTTIDNLCQVIVLARGVHQISVKAADALQDSMFRPILQWKSLQQNLTQETKRTFERLHEAIRSLTSDDIRRAYFGAIICIQDGLAEILGGSTAVATATRVAIRMPPGYVGLLRNYDPFALVILAYYCSVLHRLRHNWCLETWGAQVARAVWSMLDHQWRSLMHWAMEDIFGPDFSHTVGALWKS